VPHNKSPEIAKRDAPFRVKSMVTPVVMWSGGSRLVHVRAGGEYKRRPMVTCVKGSNRDQRSHFGSGIGRSKDQEVNRPC
jgi:hypothetical protein